MTCDEARIALGAYVLDTLDPQERATIDVHLRECAECRSELAELATLPPLLERLSLQDLGESLPSVAAPDALFDKVVASVRADEDARQGVVVRLRRRPVRALLAAAAAVAIMAGGITTAVEVTGGSSPSNTHFAASGPVHMRVTLSSQATGTALQVAVSGLPKEEHCWLVAVGDDGTRDSVSRWVATYAGEAQVTGSTAIPVSQLNRLILFGTNGKPLVTLPV
jgi:predicted anti-sigma-YlaC factor YlaD